jgi:hypothetical protein
LIRFLTPANDPDINHLFDGNPEELCYFQNMPAGVMIVTYRVQAGLTRAVNILVRKRPRGPVGFDTKQPRGTDCREEILELAKKFDPSVAKLLLCVNPSKFAL